MADYLLGADYGTGGAKVALIDAAGREMGYAFEEYPIHTDHAGWSEHDTSRYWDAFCRMTRKVLAETGVDPAELRGVATSSALPSVWSTATDSRFAVLPSMRVLSVARVLSRWQ